MKAVVKYPLMLLALMSFGSARALPTIYTVTNTADAGAGSLRQAILDANAHPGADVIRFNIGASGNLFEGVVPYTYAVIEISSSLPAITEALTIDGTTQTNTNNNFTEVKTTGVDGVSIGGIAYPDLYIVPSASFAFPSSSSGIAGNGINIDAANVTIKGIAISGFGNTHTNGGSASGHGDIAVLRSPSPRTMNISITDCFISCDPVGAFPSAAQRKTKGSGILVLGNNETGTISNNYVAHSGTYGIHFNGNVDNLNVGPIATTIGNRYWTISNNQLDDISTNTTITAISRVSDGITLMKCVAFKLINNYINNAEQMGIDLGYNSDSNYVANNTVTGFVKTTAFQLQAGIRIGLSSESDTIYRNTVFNNTANTFKGGVWLDKSSLVQTGIVTKNNVNHLIKENAIYSNVSSGVVLSTSGTAECYDNRITRNSIYNNGGLGIDLNYSGTVGPVLVSPNDDGDGDTGPNNIQNFPIIDSVRRLGGTNIGFYGKAPAGSTIEFFLSDGQLNNHGGMVLNYGEGKTFIGSAVEGSASDLANGVMSYNMDGNIGTNSNLFFITISYPGTITKLDSVTATATVGFNTSEFGPVVKILSPLAVNLLTFSSSYNGEAVKLNWKASSDNHFTNFEIEHSTDGRTFKKIGTVYPKVSGEISEYDFAHVSFANGKNFYRLKMINTGNNISYSQILAVNIKDKSDATLKVNSSFSSRIEMQLKSETDQEIAVHLFNEAGKLVRYTQARANNGTNFIQVDNVQSLPSGVYILKVGNSSAVETRKLIKQ